MNRTDEDWNYDRMHSAFSFISEVQADMMRGLHKGEVSDFVRVVAPNQKYKHINEKMVGEIFKELTGEPKC